MTEKAKCELCGEPMPEGEEMFKFHGYSGPCPKPPLEPVEAPHQKAAGEAPAEHIMQFFAYEHLPDSLQEVSMPFANMAWNIVRTIPRNPERTVALRKLLEAKDATVRAHIAKP